MAAPATPATPASYGDDFEDEFEPETPVVAAPAPAAADDDLGDLLDAIIDAPDAEAEAAPEAAAEPTAETTAEPPVEPTSEPEQRQPSREAQEDFAAAVHPPTQEPQQEPPRAYADVLILEAKEDHAAHLAELRHAHGAHFLLRLRQFLSIARADRAGVDQRDDAGDPGLLGPSRGLGPQKSLAKSEPCLDQSVIDELSKKRDVPLALEELWREAATDVWFEGYQLLHPQSIGKMLSDIDAPYVPFARDIDDALLVVGDDAVYEYEMGDGRGDRLESSIADYLEAYRNKLLEGRFEYMDGDGCVETMASAPSRGK